MLSNAARARFTVVLVGARNPSNIGAAARAMQDFGFSDLRVVNEFAPPFEGARLEAKSAVGASHVMDAARLFSDLREAIADCTYIAGTTALGNRELRQEVVSLQTAAPHMRDAAEHPEARVALLFGSEKTGLTNEQLAHCQSLVNIPLFEPEGARHLSMNLGQSVAVCLYELSREGFEQARPLPTHAPAPATEQLREVLVERLTSLMQTTEYDKRFPGNAREIVVRQLVQQLGETRDEAATWLGLLRHIERHVAHTEE
ncbi:RNA methyltransferase [Granulicella cerasi]|uniref:RNA methyltransferase n=1 Tax=Granulicella cerasi TaxID=741063 RepID=A0ABW1ZAW2_9BACT|nr:TrmH family RNA methyltransferase [Granulicella cerasi]